MLEEKDFKILRDNFYEIAEFPEVIGAIDGTHITVKVLESMNKEKFFNRRNRVTINMQAICDYKMMFLDAVIRWQGSVYDSRIFHSSEIYLKLGNQKVNGWLLGNAGYSCKTFILTPLANTITKAEKSYNLSHATTRNVIERTFGA